MNGNMTTVQINVTQADIDAGCRFRGTGENGGGNCPIAQAVRRTLTGAPGIWVSRYMIEAWTNADSHRDKLSALGELPEEARLFIGLFDGGQDVKPFSFEVELPAWTVGKQ